MVYIVRLQDFENALKNTLGKKGLEEEKIKELAIYVLSFFGYSDEIIDNVLTTADRDIFYMLEEEGILGSTEEDAQLRKGKLWRIHYWVLKKDRILKLSKKKEKKEEEKEDYSIYERNEIWHKEDATEKI